MYMNMKANGVNVNVNVNSPDAYQTEVIYKTFLSTCIIEGKAALQTKTERIRARSKNKRKRKRPLPPSTGTPTGGYRETTGRAGGWDLGIYLIPSPDRACRVYARGRARAPVTYPNHAHTRLACPGSARVVAARVVVIVKVGVESLLADCVRRACIRERE